MVTIKKECYECNILGVECWLDRGVEGECRVTEHLPACLPGLLADSTQHRTANVAADVQNENKVEPENNICTHNKLNGKILRGHLRTYNKSLFIPSAVLPGFNRQECNFLICEKAVDTVTEGCN